MLISHGPWEIKQNCFTGHRCLDEEDVMHGKSSGAIRISFGASSTINHVIVFSKFLEEHDLDSESVSSLHP